MTNSDVSKTTEYTLIINWYIEYLQH